MEREPRRLPDDDPDIGEALRTLRRDSPPSSLDASVLAAIARESDASERTASGGEPLAPIRAASAVGIAAVLALALATFLAVASNATPSPVPGPSGAAASPTPLEGSTAAEPRSTQALPEAATSPAHDARAAAASAAQQVGEARLSPDAPSAPPRDEPAIAHPSEAELILDARRALSTSPARARARLALHRRLYPDGVLAEEREALSVEALLREGDVEAARRALERIRARDPGSAHVARLDRLLATQ